MPKYNNQYNEITPQSQNIEIQTNPQYQPKYNLIIPFLMAINRPNSS